MRRARFASRRGQSLVEFAVILPLLLVLIFGLIDYSFYSTLRIDTAQAARDGARYASFSAANAASWSAAATPANNTIESAILLELPGGNGQPTWTNSDADITIAYYLGKTPYTECGYYSVTSGKYVAETGYTQATCVIPGNQVSITLSNSYKTFSPMGAVFFHLNGSGGIPVTEKVTMIIE